jgi:hypothetical protein
MRPAEGVTDPAQQCKKKLTLEGLLDSKKEMMLILLGEESVISFGDDGSGSIGSGGAEDGTTVGDEILGRHLHESQMAEGTSPIVGWNIHGIGIKFGTQLLEQIIAGFANNRGQCWVWKGGSQRWIGHGEREEAVEATEQSGWCEPEAVKVTMMVS